MAFWSRPQALAAAALVLLAGCTGARAAGVKPSSASIVLGEALVKSEAVPSAEALGQAAGMSDLQIMGVTSVFGQIYSVRFVRLVHGLPQSPDEEYTRAVIAALASAPGIASSSPNGKNVPRDSTPSP